MLSIELRNGFLNDPFVFKQNSRLIYNTSTHAVSIMQSEEKASAEWTTSLSSVSVAANKFLKNTSTDTLSNQELINLTHNIAVINTVYQGYNEKLYQSTILKVLDVFLRVVTFGLITLTYDYIRVMALKDLKERLGIETMQHQRKQIFDEGKKLTAELHSYFTKTKGSRRPSELYEVAERLLKLSTDDFRELANDQRLQLLAIANENSNSDSWKPATLDLLHFLTSLNTEISSSFERIKIKLINNLSEVVLGSIAPEQEKRLIEIISHLIFKQTQYPLNRIPDCVIQLLCKLSTDPANFVPDLDPDSKYAPICILLTSFLRFCSTRPNGYMDVGPAKSAIVALFNNGFHIIWEHVPEEYRVPLLEGIVNFQQVPQLGTYLRDQILKTTTTEEAYSKLTKEERTHLLKLVLDLPSFESIPQAVIYDLMEQFANTEHKVTIFAKALPLVNDRNKEELNQKQQEILLAFFESCTKSQLMPPIQSLAERHRIVLLKHLVGQEQEISRYPKVALHLCLLAADQKLKKEREESIENILINIPLYKLPDEEFKKLFSTNKQIASIFERHVERRLAESGTESQFEAYYGPREADLKVDFSHLKQAVAESVAVPPLPQGVAVDLEEFYKMLLNINTSRPQEAGYVNPNEIRIDNQVYTFEELKKYMRTTLDCIRTESIPYAPSAGADKELAYTTLNLYLKHSLIELAKRQAEGQDCSRYLLDLSVVGQACYARYIGVAQELYERLTESFQLDINTLSAFLHKRLSARRDGILNYYITLRGGGGNPDVHDFALALKKVGKRFGVPASQGYQYQDIVRANEWIRDQEGQDSLYQACEKAYTPTLILNTIYKYLEGMVGHPKDKGRDHVEMIQEWFKEQWAKEHSGKWGDYQKQLTAYNAEMRVYEKAFQEYEHQLKLFKEGKIKKEPTKLKKPKEPINPSSEILFTMYDENTGKITRAGLIYFAKQQDLLIRSTKDKLSDGAKRFLGAMGF